MDTEAVPDMTAEEVDRVMVEAERKIRERNQFVKGVGRNEKERAKPIDVDAIEEDEI